MRKYQMIVKHFTKMFIGTQSVAATAVSERESGPVAINCQVSQVARDLFLFGPIGSLAFVSSRSFL